eukprot:TRINITY_DN4913_c0_g1_i1.p1 TRINITY_DN4913_c0_g1~~TRINITY_DN4913_c0_g1_i1.p1  ORF type:complete len:350 (+),score=94.07 TRINITY_DN4913_c0_g1_i1:50-1099(+)
MTSSSEEAMQHITANAQHYFEVVRGHGRRGLLWLVFSTTGGRLGVKSLSFLPLEAVESSQSESLMSMYRSYKEDTQFVCWYTLEDETGAPIFSKVVVVDSSVENVTENSIADSRQQTPPPSSVALTPVATHQSTPIKSNAAAVINRRTPPNAEIQRNNHQSIQDTFSASPPIRRSEDQQDFQSLLRTTLDLAAAAGKMRSSIDTLNCQVLELTTRLDAKDHQVTTLSQRVADLETALRTKSQPLPPSIPQTYQNVGIPNSAIQTSDHPIGGGPVWGNDIQQQQQQLQQQQQQQQPTTRSLSLTTPSADQLSPSGVPALPTYTSPSYRSSLDDMISKFEAKLGSMGGSVT